MKIDKKDLKNLSILNSLKRGYNLNESYYGDKNGNVFKINNDDEFKKIKPYINRDGYVEYVLTNKDGKKKHIMGHIITAGLWLTKKDSDTEVNHKDGNRKNNKVGNLEWSDHPDNIQHSYDELRNK